MKTIAIINGPNLDRLGEREPVIYGDKSLKDLESILNNEAKILNLELKFFQSNHEGVLIDVINKTLTSENVSGLIINPGALTHTSLALKDAIAGSNIKTVEVHISNIYKRESIRQHSISAAACEGVISGLGFNGYIFALKHLANEI